MSPHTISPPDPVPCFDVGTTEGFKAFSAWLFDSQHAAHARAAIERAARAARSLASAPVAEPLTDADCIEIDLAIHRWKEDGGPARDADKRAIAIELGIRRFT